ncbi:MAG: hypothetical protein LBE24_04025 [Methylobacillus sp.]|jgi:hypothetical protein|nr:hypothetical protein [Methylobacillus sp.]
MGMLDNYTVLADNQAVTASGDTASTNIYDSLNPNAAELGLTTENLWINVWNSAPVTGTGTIQAVLQDSADGTAWADKASGPVVQTSALTGVGTPLMLMQPPIGVRQFFRIVFRSSAAIAAGTFNAFVSNTIQWNKARPSGFEVL